MCKTGEGWGLYTHQMWSIEIWKLKSVNIETVNKTSVVCSGQCAFVIMLVLVQNAGIEFDAVSVGAILSDYQRVRVENVYVIIVIVI